MSRRKGNKSTRLKFRNKDCEECPQNKREDKVWAKGFKDGSQLANANFKKVIGKLYWRKY